MHGKKLSPADRPVATKEQLKEINKKFSNKKFDAEKDNKIKSQVIELALKVAENPANSDIQILKNKEILDLCKSLNAKICWSCQGPNCYSKQMICNGLGVQKKYVGNCLGKPITFKGLKAREAGANTATAQINVPATADSESEGEEFFNVHYATNSDNEDRTFYAEHMVAGFTLDYNITEETLPNYDEMMLTELVPDKECIICGKDKIDLIDLSEHYSDHHDITFVEPSLGYNSPLPVWIRMIKEWKESGRIGPAESAPPPSGPEDSDMEAYYNEDIKEEVMPDLHMPPFVKEESSSDSSSGTSSNGKRKIKRKRDTKETLSSVRKLEISQSNTDKQLKIIADNQREIKALFLDTQSSMNNLQEKNSVNENTVRVIQEGIVSNTLAIKSNFNITKEHNLLIDKRLDIMVKQGKDHNDKIEAKQDLIANVL